MVPITLCCCLCPNDLATLTSCSLPTFLGLPKCLVWFLVKLLSTSALQHHFWSISCWVACSSFLSPSLNADMKLTYEDTTSVASSNELVSMRNVLQPVHRKQLVRDSESSLLHVFTHLVSGLYLSKLLSVSWNQVHRVGSWPAESVKWSGSEGTRNVSIAEVDGLVLAGVVLWLWC